MPNDFPSGFVPDGQSKFPVGFVPDAEAVPPAPDLSGPAHAAARRNALAQPGITPARRAASPINQNILKGIQDFGTVASVAAPGLDVLSGAKVGAALGPSLYRAGTAIVKPLVKSAIGAAAGGLGGREIGGLVGYPEVGEKVGTAAGALYGGFGGKLPTKSSLLRSVLDEEPAVGAPESIPSESMPPRMSGEPTLPKPLSNAQIGKSIESGVREAAGTPPLRPGVSLRNQLGTVGAKSVAAEPNVELPGPRIATPSRNEALIGQAGKTMENAAEGIPTPERNEGAFYKDFSPRERQDIHTNLEVRTPNGYEPVANASQHWEKLSQTPDIREDLFQMENDQVREALRKSGLADMENKTVKSSDWTFQGKAGKPFQNPDVIPRAKAIGMMLDEGIPPEDIVKWGGGAETRSKPALPRMTPGPERKGLVTGPADRGYPLVNPLKPKGSGL